MVRRAHEDRWRGVLRQYNRMFIPMSRVRPGSTTAQTHMSQRVLTPELMDDAGLDPREHRRALCGLSRLNRLSRAPVGVACAVRQLLDARGISPSRATLLDLACGGGDLLLGVRGIIGGSRSNARPEERPTDVATDVSETALDVLRERAERQRLSVRCVRADVLAGPLPFAEASVDICMCSLFLHHLTRSDAVGVLREMARVARVGLVVSDLVRSRTGLVLAWWAGRLVTRSRVVHVDSIKSVRAAWTRDELAELAREAGLDLASTRAIWPQRTLLVWSRP